MDPLGETASAPDRFREAVEIMALLRSPDGCPWDREQNFDSIRKYTLEECYEVFDAIERRDWPHLEEELGDLLLQVLFYAQMASEAGYFDIADVLGGLSRKLVRRHPHVFGDDASAAASNGATVTYPVGPRRGMDSAQVLQNWEAIKAAEKPEPEQPAILSRLASVPRALPALMEARKLGSRASKSNFDWPDPEGLFAKLEEEIAELQHAVSAKQTADIEDEVGDLLFTAVNLARHLDVDPEMALRRTNLKFRDRFAHMEEAASQGQPLEQLTPPELEELWLHAKDVERTRQRGES